MRQLRTLISVANLAARKRGKRGQIATFLLLGLGVVLILALATANLGQFSLATTEASNTADSAVLLLGSQLATKANVHYQTLGERIQKCKRTGFLGTLLAIVVAIAVTVLTWGVGAPIGMGFFAFAAQNLGLMMAVGAAGGFLGGAIGGAVVHGTLSGALTGGLHGAMTGAAIGGGISSVAHGVAKAAATTAVNSLQGAGEMAALGAGDVYSAAYANAMAQYGAAAGVAGGSSAVGGSVYHGVTEQMKTEDSFTVAAKAISGLPERDQIRESVFLQAFSQTVKDPNLTDGTCHWPTPEDAEGIVQVTGDPDDHDADGDRAEQIPCFRYWWDQRIVNLKAKFPELQADIEAFLNGPMTTFETAAEATYLSRGAGSRCGDQVCDFDESCGWVNQCESDCHEECNPDQGD